MPTIGIIFMCLIMYAFGYIMGWTKDTKKGDKK